MPQQPMARKDFRKALQALGLTQTEFAILAGRSLKGIQDNLSGRVSKSEHIPPALATQTRMFLFLAKHHKEAWAAVKKEFLEGGRKAWSF